jgi:restriction system protein
MALWLVRAGRHGEQEEYALGNGVVVIGWDRLGDLGAIESPGELRAALVAAYPAAREATIANWVSQLWAFLVRIAAGDLVALPLKGTRVVAFGRVTGAYRYDVGAGPGARHQRPVEWLRDDMPRHAIDRDLLYSLGASMTVCRISRNHAEQRIRALVGSRRGG